MQGRDMLDCVSKPSRRRRDGWGTPIPHPDAIEIKTVPEQIIKVLALHIDKCGAAGGETPPLRCNARICRQ